VLCIQCKFTVHVCLEMDKSSLVPEPPIISEEGISLTQFFKSGKSSAHDDSSNNFEHLFEANFRSGRQAEINQSKRNLSNFTQCTLPMLNKCRQQPIPLPPYCEHNVPLTQIFENQKLSRDEFQLTQLLTNEDDESTLLSCYEEAEHDSGHDRYIGDDQHRKYVPSEHSQLHEKQLFNSINFTGAHYLEALSGAQLNSNSMTSTNNCFETDAIISTRSPSNMTLSSFSQTLNKDTCCLYSSGLSLPDRKSVV